MPRRHPQRRFAAVTLALVCALALPTASALDRAIPGSGLPSAANYSTTLLPERPDVVSWRMLSRVEPVTANGRMTMQFPPEVKALDRKVTQVQGFMIPLDTAPKQKRLLLSAVPMHCSFCLPAGPEEIVEVMARTPVAYSMEPIIVRGTFALAGDAANGILYRVTDAIAVGSALPAPPTRPDATFR